MRRTSCTSFLTVFVLSAAFFLGCGDDGPPADAGGDAMTDAGDAGDAGDPVPPPPVIGDVEESARFELPCLSERAYNVFTEHEVPHVYGASDADAACVMGFVMARHRFFIIDLERRLGTGRLTELLGQDVLDVDLESRGTAMTRVTDSVLASLTPEQEAMFDAFAGGVNAYIEATRNRRTFPPSEYEVAAPILGFRSAVEMMEDFNRRDIVAIATVLLYRSSYETGDIRRDSAYRTLERGDLYAGEAFEGLRMAGAWDAYGRVTNANGYASASIWGLETAGATAMPLIFSGDRYVPERGIPQHLPPQVVDRLLPHLDRVQARLGRDTEAGYGSNAWAAGGSITADGSAIFASEAHLGGSVPTPFYRAGSDTRLLGTGGGRARVGMYLPGLPVMMSGTNGDIAFSSTQHFGDITDWYQEELILDSAGVPMATIFEGAERALVQVDEEYVIADLPALDSVGRTETWARWETYDGRIITSIEGRDAAADEVLGAGETLVNLLGSYVVPEDTDGDGMITALSFDYTPLDGGNYINGMMRWGESSTVREMYDNSQGMIGASQNFIAADSSGSVMFTPYQAMPCRRNLRGTDGRWADGAHPGRLIDGTRFGGFEIPLTAEGNIDESAPDDPQRCTVPHDEYIAAIDPASGFVASANADPGDLTADNDLENDPWYIGGPFQEDYRVTRIAELLTAGGDTIDEDYIRTMQADIRSPLGAQFVPLLLESIEAARTAAAGTPAAGSPEERMAAQWAAKSADYIGLETRIMAWRDGGHIADSGVETFYNTPVADTARDNAVATMLFNAWWGPFVRMALGDERLPSGTHTPTSGARMRVVTRMLDGRGPGNPLMLAEYNAATEESVFFDVLGTPEVETSQEIAMLAIDEALVFLRSESTGPGQGGFGNDDWDSWLWGLRHHGFFEALLGDFIDADDASFGFLLDMYSITPERIPLMADLPAGDPRANLPGFPKGGDNFTVDTANSGFGGRDFDYGSVSVWRMIITLRGDATTGENMMHAGESGRPATPAFDDQTFLWLGNEPSPMRLTPEQVVEGASARETFVPVGEGT
ncbi:MAG: penicillin acylase family protein [Deltaproteobacteria bacterium]|nr:penicillin acylase family protein [Deltaproteobacteria bacterium]